MSIETDIAGQTRVAQLSAASVVLQSIIADLAPAQLNEFTLLDRARRHFNLRRVRDQSFPEGLFAEPSWDILLDLYIAMQSGRQLSVTALCTIQGVPPTTALRHLGELVCRGLIVREPCPNDRRRVFVKLSADATRRIGTVLGST